MTSAALVVLLFSTSVHGGGGGGSDHHYITQVAACKLVTKHVGWSTSGNAALLVPIRPSDVHEDIQYLCQSCCYLVCKQDDLLKLPPFAATTLTSGTATIGCAPRPLSIFGDGAAGSPAGGGRKGKHRFVAHQWRVMPPWKKAIVHLDGVHLVPYMPTSPEEA